VGFDQTFAIAIVPACFIAVSVFHVSAAGAAPLRTTARKTRDRDLHDLEGPGKNQAGVGTTTSDQTQGNTTDTSPEPQDLQSSQSCNPPSLQRRPCNP
jgi:hypothetical protein